MDNISKIFIYGTLKKTGLCRENAEVIEDEVIDTIYEVLEAKGYELAITANYVENNFNVESRQRRERRLIDANNLDWSGFNLTEAFAESVEAILNQQKEVKLNQIDGEIKNKPPKLGFVSEQRDPDMWKNPCDGCNPIFGCDECSRRCDDDGW